MRDQHGTGEIKKLTCQVITNAGGSLKRPCVICVVDCVAALRAPLSTLFHIPLVMSDTSDDSSDHGQVASGERIGLLAHSPFALHAFLFALSLQLRGAGQHWLGKVDSEDNAAGIAPGVELRLLHCRR